MWVRAVYIWPIDKPEKEACILNFLKFSLYSHVEYGVESGSRGAKLQQQINSCCAYFCKVWLKVTHKCNFNFGVFKTPKGSKGDKSGLG